MESIRLWLALTPKQFEDLNIGKEIQPDEYSKRFGLRKDPVAAVERAQYFNDWTPDGPKGEFCAKDYVLVEVELTAIGYLQKAEAGILLKYKPNEYRWQGTIWRLWNSMRMATCCTSLPRTLTRSSEWAGLLPMYRFL